MYRSCVVCTREKISSMEWYDGYGFDPDGSRRSQPVEGRGGKVNESALEEYVFCTRLTGWAPKITDACPPFNQASLISSWSTCSLYTSSLSCICFLYMSSSFCISLLYVSAHSSAAIWSFLHACSILSSICLCLISILASLIVCIVFASSVNWDCSLLKDSSELSTWEHLFEL